MGGRQESAETCKDRGVGVGVGTVVVREGKGMGMGSREREEKGPQSLRGEEGRLSPSLRSQPSRSGLKNVCVRSFPSSSGILKGSLRMLSYRF